jgi:RNA polymerase sigma factor (sigma-70 family)
VRLPPFQVLLDAHGAVVHRFLVAAVGPVDADDCFQEACIAALRAYPRLESDDNLRGWLLRIAQRKAIDAHRAAGRRAAPVERLPDVAVAPVEPVDGEPELWARVRALPEKQRMAVFLRSVADLSYAEVAAALDCSQDAARRNVHEGLKRLREELVA